MQPITLPDIIHSSATKRLYMNCGCRSAVATGGILLRSLSTNDLRDSLWFPYCHCAKWCSTSIFGIAYVDDTDVFEGKGDGKEQKIERKLYGVELELEVQNCRTF